MRTLFWGAGLIGRRMISICSHYGYRPDYIVDSNCALWGSCVDDIQVISPTEIMSKESYRIYVTCNRFDEINNYLKEENSNHSVYKGNRFVFLLRDNDDLKKCVYNAYLNNCSKPIRDKIALFMDNGAVMGGVESWCIQSGSCLLKRGKDVYYVIPSSIPISIDINKERCVLYGDESRTQDDLLGIVDSIFANQFSVLICNFPSVCFEACCIVKMLVPEIKLISVVHNDEELYYQSYTYMQGYIDKCLVISKKIRNIMIDYGFPKRKLVDMEWLVPIMSQCGKRINRNDKTIAIGYAGRIVVEQKRSDLLLCLAKKMWEKDIPFKLSIAGNGSYFSELREELLSTPYRDRVFLLGQIDRVDIPNFWLAQDICISCSEWEGRSISKAEAMVCNTVPIVTDTSGAEDDIDDGINGYIVSVGDIESMVDRIEYLYNHPAELYAMSIKARNKIIENNSKYNERDFWNSLLSE